MLYAELIANIKKCRRLLVSVKYGGNENDKEYFKAVKKDVLTQLYLINANITKCQGLDNFEFEATITTDIGTGFDVYMG